MVEIADKKCFLKWCIQHLSFSKREIDWILNYLVSHDSILNKIIFVEQSDKTPRGLRIHAENSFMTLFIQGHSFTDTEQIFHEIRLNAQKELYVEIILNNAWHLPEYLAVLEDNPYNQWNEQLAGESYEEMEKILVEYNKQKEVQFLQEQIDLVLEKGDKKKFQQLTDQLRL